MAAGAGDPYWGRQGLPSVFKHELLRLYLPKFGGKTGSRGRGVVYLDGYAGRGRYEDGSPGSAERILKIAEDQRRAGINYRLFFHEKDPKSYDVLKPVVDEYAARGVQAKASPENVSRGMDEVISVARDTPLFLFLDPCGLGLPFDRLTGTLTGPRVSQWPPTEVLLNFSLEAVRRIGGHVVAEAPNEKTMARLDVALGGTWWRDIIRNNGVTDDAVSQIVHEFVDRFSEATNMHVYFIPVRRAPHHKPVYYLVFGTRSMLGIWYFADAAARATEKWWETLDARESAREEAAGIVPLFDIPNPMRPDIKEVETEARPVIAENIAELADRYGKFKVGDRPAEVFGDYLGRVRETVVRTAIKDLHAAGRTPSDGKGSPIAGLTVIRQQR